MKNKKIITIIGVIVVVIVLVIVAISWNSKGNMGSNDLISIQTEEIGDTSGYNEVAIDLELAYDEDEASFLINGEVVPDEIRVKPNTYLKVNVTNNSDSPTSVHFHGVNGMSKMDGVGGVTQEGIGVGESFTYEFLLDEPGTYMYHAHMDSANQVNNENLFGGLVVEEETKTNSEMLIFNTNVDDYNAHHSASLTYNDVEVNGNTKLEYNITNDENIFINLTNLSSGPISLSFGDNVKYRINSVDSHPTNSDWSTKGLIVPTANRMQIEIENPKDSFVIQSTLKGKQNANVFVNYKENESAIPVEIDSGVETSMMGGQSELLDSSADYLYDVIESTDDLGVVDEKPDVSVNMELNMDSGYWVINDKAYPDTDSIKVSEGDIVEITLNNTSHMGENHPFHLHGHEFQVTEVNGQEIDKTLNMDTVEVLPGNSMTIKFKANNPGIWAFHCHDLTHAGKGMFTTLEYDGYESGIEGSASE